MKWTQERRTQLVQLFDIGVSRKDIAYKFGVSKNSVINALHTYHDDYKVDSSIKIKLSELDWNNCLWPFGDPKDNNFYFCGKSVINRGPYCEEHCAKAGWYYNRSLYKKRK